VKVIKEGNDEIVIWGSRVGMNEQINLEMYQWQMPLASI